ncbi:MAG: NusG domain II-containing protein [Lachnospiraceae bacterium]
MKKNDFILIVVILCIAGTAFGLHAYLSGDNATYVEITIDGKKYGSYDLNIDQKIKINNTNVLAIKGKKATMISANCPDQICVHQSKISKNKETIICLPNKIIVEVHNGTKNDIDAIAN